jgi:hypothetical protein
MLLARILEAITALPFPLIIPANEAIARFSQGETLALYVKI